jgi:hypothetical protein
MVKIRIPMMVDDARFAPLGRKEAVEGVDLEEAWFGTVRRRTGSRWWTWT